MIFPNSENYNKMGRQINFFMMSEDITELDEKLKKDGFLIIADRMNTSEIIELESLNANDNVTKYLILANEKDKMKIHYIVKKKQYIVHPMYSPVIEFWPSYIDIQNKRITEGRLYYTTEGLTENKEVIKHSNEFIKSAEKLFRWYKNRYRNNKTDGYYITQKVMKWTKETGISLFINLGQTELTL